MCIEILQALAIKMKITYYLSVPINHLGGEKSSLAQHIVTSNKRMAYASIKCRSLHTHPGQSRALDHSVDHDYKQNFLKLTLG